MNEQAKELKNTYNLYASAVRHTQYMNSICRNNLIRYSQGLDWICSLRIVVLMEAWGRRPRNRPAFITLDVITDCYLDKLSHLVSLFLSALFYKIGIKIPTPYVCGSSIYYSTA